MVVFANVFLNAVGDPAQCLVAGAVPITVVHRLEKIDVQHGKRVR
ncbi:MAG: hypothetical protein H6R17_2252 [Proteobacteria bacterium]|nr:hypothetical protein [Pseudomonadota bacterium]